MKIQAQCLCAGLYSKFKSQSHGLDDISELVELLRMYLKDVSVEAKRHLCLIPLQVLENQVVVSNETMLRKQCDYFCGNMLGTGQFQDKYKERFMHGIELHDISNLLNDIMADEDRLKNDFYLRNVAVFLSDYASEKEHSNFKESGLIFARIMEEAFLL